MTAPETLAVFAALGEARFVGGAVRNALLGTAVIDIDIAVPMPPDETLARLAAQDIKAIPTGIAHGTVTAVAGKKAFEITSLRRDVAGDGRHAVVAFTDEWAEDAARRDFTINALYAAPDGEIFDFHGGVEDLIAGRVRFIGDPAARIAEDYLRILRLFRFHAWVGKGEIDAAGLRAAAAAKAHLHQLSGERTGKEMLRLLEAVAPGPVLRVMAATGILSEILPGALQVARLEKLCQIEAESLAAPDPLLRLAALLADDAGGAAAARLKLSNVDKARLEDALAGGIAAGMRAHEARKLLYRLGSARFRDRVLLKWAGAPGMAWRMLLAMADGWQQPRFALTGHDVMQAGVPEGPQVGTVLAALEDWWIEGDFAADEGALRDRLAGMVRDGA